VKKPVLVGVATALVACLSLNANASVDGGKDTQAQTFKTFKAGKVEVTDKDQKFLFDRMIKANPEVPAHMIKAKVLATLKTQAALKNEALKQGLDKRADIASRVKLAGMGAMADAVVDEYVKNHPVTEKEMRDAYERDKATYGKSEYRIQNILVEDEAKAKAVIAEIKNKDDFSRMAKLSSLDPSTKNNGGMNNYMGSGMLSPEIRNVVVKLDAGQFTKEPIKTSAGWQIIRVDDVRPAKNFPSYEKAKDNLKRSVANEKAAIFIQDVISKTLVK